MSSGRQKKKPQREHQSWVVQRDKRKGALSSQSVRRKREHGGVKSHAAKGSAAAASKRAKKAQQRRERAEAASRWKRVYRGTRVGRALVRSLDLLVHERALTVAQAAAVLDEFDVCMHGVLARWARDSHGTGLAGADSLDIAGTVTNYNFVDNTWRFDLRDAVLTRVGGYVAGRPNVPTVLRSLTLVCCEDPTVAEERARKRKRKREEAKRGLGVNFHN